jgi:hypothetical protein
MPVAREDRLAPHPTHSAAVVSPADPRRLLLGAVRKIFDDDEAAADPNDAPPRLTPKALASAPVHTSSLRMSRSRDRILANLEEMYREAFERAKASGDLAQQASLDFAYRREQLYFEILLDVRDAVERRV